MPELPEVETVVNDLKNAGVIGAVFERASVYWPKTIAVPTSAEFRRDIRGRSVVDVRRRGKYIVVELSGLRYLLIHLRMTGRVLLSDRRRRRAKHEHVILNLDDGRQLRFHDTRKFGRMYLLGHTQGILGRLGPEPLDKRFTGSRLFQILSRRNRQLKPILLDQTVIAGLGNIYVDEALWEARLHPLRRTGNLTLGETRRLHRAIRKVLRRGIENAGTTFSSGRNGFASIRQGAGRNRKALMVFRRTSEPCPRCHTPISRIIVAQRSTHLCATCQLPETNSG